MRIMGVDPGGTTGIAVIDVPWDENRYAPTPDTHVYNDQLEAVWGEGSDSIGPRLEALIKSLDIGLLVVEKFIITAKTVQYTRQPDAMWIIGGVRFVADGLGIPVHMQASSLAKPAWDAKRLQSTGWAKVVKRKHARDALRHALTACATYKGKI